MTAEGLGDVWRESAPHVLAALVRRFGDFDAAEDAAQEALLAATRQWPREGCPRTRPGGWSRSPRGAWSTGGAATVPAATASLREAVRTADALAVPAADADVGGRDDSLALLLLCCHPALSRPSQVALTLRAVGGLTTAQVARGFMVPEATAAQRISRAKATLRRVGAPFEVSGAAEPAGPGGCRGTGALPRVHRGAHVDDGSGAERPLARHRGDPAGAGAARAVARRRRA
ncbi:hypothetical protein GCM10025868_27720 [Angustibacter aerolatus]|uniref:RNA polymerase sigma factor 70 region 4 type 2 domain-containing protein n=1 Tax=Angustibacter aerolatus TaxID=1162965 RepID=A0ABQ6JH11_9ACTN|nr:sigma factor-like helix-turn-helix DNA-binding protein [Angustibacter aerolatus]GMA87522.1 hypothetical protein GCM10025868_27720 [Angustibacter aerolatus]